MGTCVEFNIGLCIDTEYTIIIHYIHIIHTASMQCNGLHGYRDIAAQRPMLGHGTDISVYCGQVYGLGGTYNPQS